MSRIAILFLLVLFSDTLFSQKLESGPMVGYLEHREALIWISADKDCESATIEWWPAADPSSRRTITKSLHKKSLHQPVSFVLEELEMNTGYEYQILFDGKKVDTGVENRFKTKELWEWRKPAPDFSFLFGSCAYVNDSLYDRPGKKYGQSTEIFHSMYKTPSDFTIWGGDNLYFREADMSSGSGMLYRYSHDRSIPELKKLLSSRANYATWDDHDYGPNDANCSYELKHISRSLFKEWWGNKTYGEDGKGIYSKFSWNDCDFFLLDDRWFRSPNSMEDSIDGKPDPSKRMLGEEQMDWLMNSLLTSRATFKFIICGGQMLNPENRFEAFIKFPYEYNELLSFLDRNKLDGVIFLSGDRHLSELIRIDRTNAYPLYDFTCSALTSGAYKLSEKDREFRNPYRIEGSLITENNFSRISVKGEKKERALDLEIFSKDGKLMWKQTIMASELKYNR